MKETAEEAVMHTRDLYQAYDGKGGGRISIWFAIRQVMTCSRDLLAMVRDAAELNTGIHAHLCEHKDEVSFCLQNYHALLFHIAGKSPCPLSLPVPPLSPPG